MCSHSADASGIHSIRRRSNAFATARWRARKAPKGTQLGLAGLRDHGGERRGGRRRKRTRSRVAHRARPVHKSRFPVHITLRAVEGLVSFRRPRLFAALRSAIARSQRGAKFRITDFSIEPAHGHFITEATDERALSNGVRALVIRLTLAIRRSTGYRGAIWADRYHAHELRSPREYRNALSYVLNNWKKHVRGASDMDPCSSAPWFSGWSDLAKSCWDGWASAQPGVMKPWMAVGPEAPPRLSARGADTTPLCPVVPPKTWLAKDGWRTKSGLGTIKLGECPADADPMRMLQRAARSGRRRRRSLSAPRALPGWARPPSALPRAVTTAIAPPGRQGGGGQESECGRSAAPTGRASAWSGVLHDRSSARSR